MNLFPAPQPLDTRIVLDVVKALDLRPRSSPWLEHAGWPPMHSFLEGPNFDRAGRLYFVNLAHGEIYRADLDGSIEVVARYGGAPNGLRIHRDGRIFIADRIHGVMELDPHNGKISTYLGCDRMGAKFKGLNDLFFASNGDLYFTDQGTTDLRDPTGRVFRYSADGQLDCLLNCVPSPNGIVMNPKESHLFVAATFGPQVWRCGIRLDGSIERVGAFQTFSGGYSGPDGLAMTEAGGLAVCHNRLGTVWLFDPLGGPEFRIRSAAGLQTTNLCFGGPDSKTLYITEAETGCILACDLPHRGMAMFSQMS